MLSWSHKPTFQATFCLPLYLGKQLIQNTHCHNFYCTISQEPSVNISVWVLFKYQSESHHIDTAMERFAMGIDLPFEGAEFLILIPRAL